MRINIRILLFVVLIMYFIMSLCNMVFAWEMEGDINPETGTFNHDFIAEQAVKILFNDWYGATENDMLSMGLDSEIMDSEIMEHFDKLMDYKSDFEQGACDPDKDTMNNNDLIFSSHFYDPDTKQTWYIGKKDLTAEVQVKRFVRMAIARYNEAEESRAKALNLIENAEKKLMNTSLNQSQKDIFIRYKNTILKSDINATGEQLKIIKSQLIKKKMSESLYVDGLDSARQLAELNNAKRQLEYGEADLEYAENIRKILIDDYEKKQKRMDLTGSGAIKGPYKEAEKQLKQAKERIERNERSIESLKQLIEECKNKISSFTKEKTEEFTIKERNLKNFMIIERAAVNYEKAVTWYKVVKLADKSPGSNGRQRIEGNNLVLRNKSNGEKVSEALKSITNAEKVINDLIKSSSSNHPQYNAMVLEYINKIKEYKNAVLGYMPEDMEKLRKDIENIKVGMPKEQSMIINTYEGAFDAYFDSGKKYAAAAYCFGYACHFFADTCNPHHAVNNIVPEPPYNHRSFELYSQENGQKFGIDSIKQVTEKNLYGIGGRFIDQSDCFKMGIYNDISDCTSIYDFVTSELSVMGKVAKDYYYICDFENNPNPKGLLKKEINENGVLGKELVKIKEKWDETAERTLAVSQGATAKLFLKFLLEIKNSEKITVVAKTADGYFSPSEDHLYLYLKSKKREERIFLDKNNDIIKETYLMDNGNYMIRVGETENYPVYINRKLWCNEGESLELDQCRLEIVKREALPDSWDCDNVKVIYKDKYLIAQSEEKKCLKWGADDKLSLELYKPGEREMEKISLHLKKSSDSPVDSKDISHLVFGMVDGNGNSDELKLYNFTDSKTKPGQIYEYDYYIPVDKGKVNGLKKCWIEPDKPLGSMWKCRSLEVYMNDRPVSLMYNLDGFLLIKEKLYLINDMKSIIVKVKTRDRWFAGTDDDISFYIKGKDGEKTEYIMDKKYYNDFEKGQTDTYHFVVEEDIGIKDITDIHKMGIEKKNGVVSDDWICEFIEIWYCDSLLSYKHFDEAFDSENPGQEWDVTQKLYVAVTGKNGEKIGLEGLSLNLKFTDGEVKSFLNPVFTGEGKRKAHEFDIINDSYSLDLRKVEEVWLESKSNSAIVEDSYQCVEIFSDASLKNLVSYHNFAGKDIGDHWNVFGLRPFESINASVVFQTEEIYKNDKMAASQCPTYLILGTDIKSNGRPVYSEIRCVPRIESKKINGNNVTYVKTYTVEFKINKPDFLVSNINEVRIEKRLNNNGAEPESWDCKVLDISINGRILSTCKNGTYNQELLSGIKFIP